MDKEDVVMEYYSAMKKNENFAIGSNMDGLGGHYATRTKSGKINSE